MKQFLSEKRKKGLFKHVQFIALLTFLLLFTQTLLAQVLDKKISLPAGTTTGLKVVAAIKEQIPTARFTFDEAISAKLGGQIKVPATQLNVKEVLDLLKSAFDISYKNTGNYIILSMPITPKSPNVQAGQGPGTIKGRIVEFETSQPLPGASIQILGLNKGGQSDNNGYYKLTNLPAGKYTIQVSYVSFKTEKVEVEVKAGKEETYDVKLQGSSSLNEVVVSSVRKTRTPVAHTSEKQLVAELRNMSLVASGISSQQISMSADRNAAEVIQRISGVSVVDDRFVIVRGLNPRYNLTYLNDNVAPSTEVNSRSFALDLIPSRIIDKILVFKSPSPENQADATGGVIKIYTKDAKNVKHFDIEIQTGYREGTTFNSNFLTYKGGKLDFLGFDDGTRGLPKILPGYGSLVKAQLSPSQYVKAMSPTLTYYKTTALPNLQITANYYNSFKLFGNALSSLTSLSYKNEFQKNTLFRQDGMGYDSRASDQMGYDDRNFHIAQLNLLQNFAYTLKPGHVLSFKNFLFQQGTDNTVETNRWGTGILLTPEQSNDYKYPKTRDIILSYKQRFLYAGNLGGAHEFGANKQHNLRWNGGYTYSRQDIPDQRVTHLQNYDYTKSEYLQNGNFIARTLDSYGLSAEDDAYVPLSRGIISRMWSRNSEGVYNGSVDYAFKFRPWLSAKAGTFQQWKSRTLYRRIYTVNEAKIDNVDDPYTKMTGQENRELTHFHDYELFNLWSEKYLNDNYDGLAVNDRTRGSDTYQATEQNNSGYAMLNFAPANRFIEISGGFRYEYNRQKIAAAVPPDPFSPGQLNIPVLIDHPMRSWLPSINLSIRPNEQFVFRAAYGKTVNRTEFREVSPFEELDFENNTIIQGSPTLTSATAINYDARLEFYPKAEKGADMISIGAFYKDIANPIERINTSIRYASYYTLLSYRNATSAKLKGLEVEVRKSLDFIPLRFFRNLTFAGNASFIHSRAKFDGLDQTLFIIAERPLQGQAPYLINAGLYYDNAGTGSKVAVIYNTSGENIYAAGRGYKYNDLLKLTEYRGSLIELPRHLLDVSYTQRIGKGLQAKLTVQNLLDQQIRLAEDFNFTNKYEKSKEVTKTDNDGTVVKAGEGDNISSSYRPGRYVNLSFSYAF